MFWDVVISAALCVVTIGMGYTGVHVTLHPAETQFSKLVYKALFFLFGLASVALVVWQGVRNGRSQQAATKATAELEGTLRALGVSTDRISFATQETVRIQTLNTHLQQKLLEQSSTISELSKRAIDTTTGGDSFCYIDMIAASGGRITVVHEGKFPLYDVSARIVDLDSWDQIKANGQQMTFDLINRVDRRIDLGSIPVRSATAFGLVSSVRLKTDHGRYNIFFSARNGFWTEALRIENGAEALMIRKDIGRRTKVLLKRVDRNYPHEPEW